MKEGIGLCVCVGGREGAASLFKTEGPVMIDSTALLRRTPKDFAQAFNAFVPLSQDTKTKHFFEVN